MSDDARSYIPIGRVGRPHGLNGAVRFELRFDEPRVLTAGQPVVVRLGSEERETVIEFFRPQHGRPVLKLASANSVEDAEEILGASVDVAVQHLPPLDAGAYYTFQLRGCDLYTASGQRLGSVVEVQDWGGTEILRVMDGERETLVPFAKAYLRDIDVAGKRIVVDLPDGLLGLNP